MTGESKTKAVRRALLERRSTLRFQVNEPKSERLLRFLEEEVWPHLPGNVAGKDIPQIEQDDLLGYGPEGI